MNAKEEFLELVEGKQVKCATIRIVIDWGSEPQRAIDLKVGYSEEDYDKFLTDLDIEYDDGYVSQELFGLVWFNDNTWAERHEYDGSEYWSMQSFPDIPKELLS